MILSSMMMTMKFIWIEIEFHQTFEICIRYKKNSYYYWNSYWYWSFHHKCETSIERCELNSFELLQAVICACDKLAHHYFSFFFLDYDAI